MKHHLLALALIAVSGPSLAEIYRWVDASGRLNFSQTPPRGFTSQRMSPAPPPAVSPSVEALAALTDASAKARAELAVKTGEQQKIDAQKAEQCSQAQARLAFLDERSPRRLARVGEDGERTRFSAEDYEAERAKAQQRIAENCR